MIDGDVWLGGGVLCPGDTIRADPVVGVGVVLALPTRPRRSRQRKRETWSPQSTRRSRPLPNATAGPLCSKVRASRPSGPRASATTMPLAPTSPLDSGAASRLRQSSTTRRVRTESARGPQPPSPAVACQRSPTYVPAGQRPYGQVSGLSGNSSASSWFAVRGRRGQHPGRAGDRLEMGDIRLRSASSREDDVVMLNALECCWSS